MWCLVGIYENLSWNVGKKMLNLLLQINSNVSLENCDRTSSYIVLGKHGIYLNGQTILPFMSTVFHLAADGSCITSMNIRLHSRSLEFMSATVTESMGLCTSKFIKSRSHGKGSYCNRQKHTREHGELLNVSTGEFGSSHMCKLLKLHTLKMCCFCLLTSIVFF